MILTAATAQPSTETFTGLMDHVAQGFEALETEIEGVAPWRRAMTGGAGTIRRAAASALESETPP
jgi:hypothetical protein